MKNKLLLIPGITGRMGQEFYNKFSSNKDFDIVGFTSKESISDKKIIYCDFLDSILTEGVFSKLNFKSYKEIYLIHCIGPFLFEEGGIPLSDFDNDGIDDKIYALNYLTFKNVTESIIKHIDNNQNVILCGFGSISDRFVIPWWQSYSKTKLILKDYILDLISKNVRGVFINVSSTEKEEERPFADKTYWLSCKEVADRSYESILNTNLDWQEVSIIKPNPNYSKDYFKNIDKIKKTWIQQLFGSEK